MKITRINVWALELPLSRPYSLAGGRSHFDHLDSTLVRLDTDEGISGWGEACPWGSTYLPALAHATPEPFRRATWLCFDKLTRNPVEAGAVNQGGWTVAPELPGIGAFPDVDALGEPIAAYAADS